MYQVKCNEMIGQLETFLTSQERSFNLSVLESIALVIQTFSQLVKII